MKRLNALKTIMVSLLVLLVGLVPHTIAQNNPPPKPLSEQVGFSDPALDALQALGENTLGESEDFQAYGHNYRLLAIWELLSDASPNDVTSIIGGAALLFQMDTAKPTLLWSQDYLKLIGQAPFLTNQHYPVFNAPAPGDWDKDGKTEFAILGSFSGTAWFSTFYYVYQIQPDGVTVTSRFKGNIPPGYIVVAIEPQFDNSIVLTVADIRGEMAMGLPNCCGPQISRYFDWRGDTLVDSSPNHTDRYFERIGSTLYRLTTEQFDNPADYAARLLELLMMYDAMGQRDAGWLLVQGLVAQAKQTGRLAEGTYVDTVFIPTMTQLYQQKQPFVAPDLLNTGVATPLPITSFYDEIPPNS